MTMLDLNCPMTPSVEDGGSTADEDDENTQPVDGNVDVAPPNQPAKRDKVVTHNRLGTVNLTKVAAKRRMSESDVGSTAALTISETSMRKRKIERAIEDVSNSFVNQVEKFLLMMHEERKERELLMQQERKKREAQRAQERDDNRMFMTMMMSAIMQRQPPNPDHPQP
jgi:hypothetical protein